MKSIFLMAILVSLVTIAFKGPNETPSEFFHRLKSLTADVVEQGMEKKKASAENDQALLSFGSAVSKLIAPQNNAVPGLKVPERDVPANHNEPIPADPQFVLTNDKEGDNSISTNGSDEAIDTLPPPVNADVPEMPAVPTETVLSEPLGEVGQLAEQTPQKSLATIPDYRDIKEYYEDANRLLAEIK
jgi:hypothetical protein